MFMLVFRCRKDANSAVKMVSNRELPIKLLGGKIDWTGDCEPRKIKQGSKTTAANDSNRLIQQGFRIYQKIPQKKGFSNENSRKIWFNMV